MQFWWENQNYNDFDDFLSRLSSSRRKSIKRERRDVHSNISIKNIMGDEINETQMDKLYEFICDTYSRKWGNGTPVSYTHLDVYKRQLLIQKACHAFYDLMLEFVPHSDCFALAKLADILNQLQILLIMLSLR